MKTSVIIPTLNEAGVLGETLDRVRSHAPHEIIIGDGGSEDATCAIAEQFNTRVVTGERGRALQMNAAAHAAEGDLLLFLHADSHLTCRGYGKMVEAMQTGKYLGGAFSLKIDSDRPWLKTVSRLATLRSRYLNLTYGDQAFFVNREAFLDLGGYRPIPICEDLEFFRRLSHRGPVILLREPAVTSARRWLADGVGFNTARNIAIASLFLMGVSPVSLSKWYPPRR